MSPLLTLNYWFSMSPTPFMPLSERLLLVVFGALFVAGIVVWVVELKGGYAKFTKRALGRVASHLIWTGLAGLLLWTFAFEQLPLLSMRAFYIVWLGWFIFGCWQIYHYVWVEIPSITERQQEREAREKWLPRKKA